MYLSKKRTTALELAIAYLDLTYGHAGDPEEAFVMRTLKEMLNDAKEERMKRFEREEAAKLEMEKMQMIIKGFNKKEKLNG